MLSRFYGRVLVVVGTGLAFLWFTFGYFHDNQYLPGVLHHPAAGGKHVDTPEDFSDKGPTQRHLYKRSGLLEVNPLGPHPIYELMERGESLWKAKLARQSTTLVQAVKEYKKRYRRDPPPGFDKWWDYTEKHNVQLRDEYDQIWLSLEPFWGLSPAKLEKLRLKAVATKSLDLFTITKEPGQNLTAAGGDDFLFAVENQLGLLEEVQDMLPPFNASYSPHDNPFQIADHEWRKRMTIAATLKKSVPDDEIIQRGELRGWKAACSPNTPYRPREPSEPSDPPSPQKKTFIFDHKIARDACSYPSPSFFSIAGLYALHKEPGPDPRTEIAPVFSVCGTSLHADIIAPTLYLWEEDVWRGDPPFSKKKNDHLFWRGRNTGSWFTNEDQHLLTMSHRNRLVLLTSDSPPPQNVTIHVLPSGGSPKDPVGKGVPYHLADVNRAMMNVSFVDHPIQCDEPTCQTLANMFTFGNFMDEAQSSEFKYVIDVDGNGWSGRFKRMMTNHALIFKSTIYIEWLTDRIAPWVHYVPIQLDYTDLYDSLFFFRGDENGKNGHPELAEKIAHAGREWSLQFWRKEDMTAYLFRLYLEYARLMSPDRTEQNFSV